MKFYRKLNFVANHFGVLFVQVWFLMAPMKCVPGLQDRQLLVGSYLELLLLHVSGRILPLSVCTFSLYINSESIFKLILVKGTLWERGSRKPWKTR